MTTTAIWIYFDYLVYGRDNVNTFLWYLCILYLYSYAIVTEIYLLITTKCFNVMLGITRTTRSWDNKSFNNVFELRNKLWIYDRNIAKLTSIWKICWLPAAVIKQNVSNNFIKFIINLPRYQNYCEWKVSCIIWVCFTKLVLSISIKLIKAYLNQ